MSHIWTRQLDNLRGCRLKGNVALRSLWQTLSINQQTFTTQHSNSPSYSQALVSVIPHWSDFRPPRQTRWFVSDRLLEYTLTSVPLVGATLCLFLTVALKEQLQTSSEVFPVTCTQPVNAPPPSMTAEYLQIGVSAPHLVPVCVNPLPSLQLSLLHCPSCKASLIATLRVMPLHVCAGVPQAGVHETGGVGGGSGGKNSLLPEGDSSPAATVKGTTGGWGQTAAV